MIEILRQKGFETLRHKFRFWRFSKIILYSLSITEIHDRRWAHATCSVRRPGRLPDWQPANHLNVLKGVEKHPVDDNWYTHLIKTVCGAMYSRYETIHSC